jgi:hypothetical protein
VWLKELEALVESQLNSYRMNVEAELLDGIVDSDNAGTGVVLPSALAITRLQNNVS